MVRLHCSYVNCGLKSSSWGPDINCVMCSPSLVCRMENREDCKKVIDTLDKAKLPGTSESITVKFADSGSSRRKLSKLFAYGCITTCDYTLCV